MGNSTTPQTPHDQTACILGAANWRDLSLVPQGVVGQGARIFHGQRCGKVLGVWGPVVVLHNPETNLFVMAFQRHLFHPVSTVPSYDLLRRVE